MAGFSNEHYCPASADRSETVSGEGQLEGQKAKFVRVEATTHPLSWMHPQVTSLQGLNSGHFSLSGWKLSDPWQGFEAG